MPSTSAEAAHGVKRSPFLFDAGVFIAALLAGDPRHSEAGPWSSKLGPEDWQIFEPEGLRIVGPPSTVNRLQRNI